MKDTKIVKQKCMDISKNLMNFFYLVMVVFMICAVLFGIIGTMNDEFDFCNASLGLLITNLCLMFVNYMLYAVYIVAYQLLINDLVEEQKRGDK